MWESVKRTVVRNLAIVGVYLATLHALKGVWVLAGRPVLAIMP